MKTTTVHTHGTGDKYLRSVIPNKISREVGLKKGSVISWDTIDSSTLIARVVA